MLVANPAEILKGNNSRNLGPITSALVVNEMLVEQQSSTRASSAELAAFILYRIAAMFILTVKIY